MKVGEELNAKSNTSDATVTCPSASSPTELTCNTSESCNVDISSKNAFQTCAVDNIREDTSNMAITCKLPLVNGSSNILMPSSTSVEDKLIERKMEDRIAIAVSRVDGDMAKYIAVLDTTPSPPPHKLPRIDLQTTHKTEDTCNIKIPILPIIEDVLIEETISIFKHLLRKQNIDDAIHDRFMLDNWERRHGIWKLYTHSISDTTNVAPAASSGCHNVVIKFMHGTLELNLTLGHQITPDTVHKNDTEERYIKTPF